MGDGVCEFPHAKFELRMQAPSAGRIKSNPMKLTLSLKPTMNQPKILISLIAILTLSFAQAQVKLEFAWPDGLQATVTQTKNKTREGTPSRLPSGVSAVFDMKAKKTAEGVVVSQNNFRLDTSALPASFSDVERKQLEIFTQAAMPSFLVSPAGDFQRLEDVSEFRDSLFSIFRKAIPSLASDPKLNELLKQITSDASLNALASADWHQTVGFWAGGTLDVGEYYRTETPSAIPFLPNKTFKMISRFKIVGKVACSRMGQDRDCVEIEMETKPDPAEIASAIEELIKQFAASPARNSTEVIDSIEMTVNTRLVTEPSSLIPHRYSTNKRIVVTTKAGNEKKALSETQDALTTYSYRER